MPPISDAPASAPADDRGHDLHRLAMTILMTPAEALWSATAGGAAALRRRDIGHLAPGARADLAVVDAPSWRHLAYRPGVPLVRALDGLS